VRKAFLFLLTGMLLCCIASVSPATAQPAVGAIYSMTNAAAGNAVVTYLRAPDGSLTFAGNTPTGGDGTGTGLGNQGGVVLSDNQRYLFVVNAGSNDLTVFAVRPHGLEWVDKVATGGTTPVSVTTNGRLVYVVHSGSDDIAGFRQGPDGTLSAIAGSMQMLSAPGAGPAQISFSPDGALLIVTEKATNVLSVFPVDYQGVAQPGIAHASAGITPFGFAFGKRGQLFVSEAFGGPPAISAVSSYVVEASGGSLLQVVSPSVATTGQSAACWVVVDKAGRYAFTTNTASASVTGYAIAADGSISLLDPSGVSATTGSTPIDADFSVDGRFLYVLNAGSSTISTIAVGANGTLTPIGMTGIVGGANGLAAR
jgi:6-phosphogluconolactonase